MKIVIKRRWPKSNYCIGQMFINGKYFCDTLEDKVVDVNKNGVFDRDEKKVYAESAIPYGTYEVIYNYSPKFKRNLPRLLNVPHFEGILIHSGNTAKDTAGCILVGKNTEKGKLTDSRAMSNKLNTLIEKAIKVGEKVTLTIE